jgi:hypothetical protein
MRNKPQRYEATFCNPASAVGRPEGASKRVAATALILATRDGPLAASCMLVGRSTDVNIQLGSEYCGGQSSMLRKETHVCTVLNKSRYTACPQSAVPLATSSAADHQPVSVRCLDIPFRAGDPTGPLLRRISSRCKLQISVDHLPRWTYKSLNLVNANVTCTLPLTTKKASRACSLAQMGSEKKRSS